MARYIRYSRLARKENKRIIRQSVMLLGLSVVIVIVLIQWGIPALVRYAGFLGEVNSASEKLDKNDVLAPFAPQVDLTLEATQSAIIDIGGFAEAKATIELFRNDTKVDETVVNDEGKFEFLAVDLADGDNAFFARAIDSAGNQSQNSPTRSVYFDNSAPEINLENLEEGKTILALDNDTLTVKGKTEPGISLYINDRLTSVGAEGEFSRQIKLNEGENRIKFRAVDKAGNVTEKEVKVNYDR